MDSFIPSLPGYVVIYYTRIYCTCQFCRWLQIMGAQGRATSAHSSFLSMLSCPLSVSLKRIKKITSNYSLYY